jgi:hypothetical protein
MLRKLELLAGCFEEDADQWASRQRVRSLERGGDSDARRGDWEDVDEAVGLGEDIGSAAAGAALSGGDLALRLTQ